MVKLFKLHAYSAKSLVLGRGLVIKVRGTMLSVRWLARLACCDVALGLKLMKSNLLLAGAALAALTLAASGAQAATNLVVNGDFEAGNTGFTSGYTYLHGDGHPPAVYDVGTNPNAIHEAWTAFGDHTTGAGNMMIINGAEVAGVPVWEESSIAVQSHTTYFFSTWIASTYPQSPAMLDFSINGVKLGATFTASTTTGVWQQFFASWDSGAATTADISLVNQNLAFSGNDFALDDISLSTAAPGVPEPATWALMLMGFGAAGAALRNRRRLAVAA
jgi:hypothetical protein